MPKIVVEGPDGRKFAFPDTMPRAEINAFMKQKYGTKAPNESVQDYLARYGREQAATEARAKDIDREATAVGRAEGERAAERMGVDNPLMMAFAAPAIGLAQQEGGRRVLDREGTVLADEAAGLSAINAAGFFVPGMVNKEFGARVEEGRRQQPLAAFAGDIAGGFGPGEIIGAGVSKAVQSIGPGFAALGRMLSRGPGPDAAPTAMPDAMPAGGYFGRQSMRPPGSGPSAREIETQQQWSTATPIVTQARTTAQSAAQAADAALQSKAPADIARAKDQKKALVGQLQEAQASRAGMDTPEDARLAETLASLNENTSDPVLLSTQISAAKTSLDRLLTDIGSPVEGNLIPVKTNILTRTQAPRSAAEGPQDRASVTRYAEGGDDVQPMGFGASTPKTPQQAARFETPGSPEYEAAVAKGLDMSQAGRMARRKEWEAQSHPEVKGADWYHGSTHDFDSFSSTGNPEGHHGGGAYFSSSPDDVARNYATTTGADLTSKIERRAEQIAYDIETALDDADFDALARMGISKEKAMSEQYNLISRESERIARAEIAGKSEGATIRAAVRAKNPVVVNGMERIPEGRGISRAKPKARSTFWDINDGYDEALDEFGEPSGPAADLIEQTRNALNDIGFDQTDDVVSRLYQKAMDGGGLSADDFERIMRNEPASYMIDYDASPGQIIQQVYKAMGHDGIVLRNAERQFANMGMSPDTTHLVIFDPSNIRSVNAAFDPEKSTSSTLLAASPFAAVSGAGLTSERELGSKMKRDKKD